MKNIIFSVVTTTYNAETTLEETILSVVNQKNVQFEYIVIDGKSTDNTVNLLKQYKDKISFWISEPDKGIYDAMNKGLQHANGDFVIFLGADDHFASFNTLNQVANHITSLNSVYYGDVYRNTRNDLYKGKFNKYIISLENICHQSIFYPKCVYKNHSYDLAYKVYADYIYNLTIFPTHQFQYIPIMISYYNYEGFSSKNPDKEFEKHIDSFIKQRNGILAWLLRKCYLLYKKLR